MLQNVKDLRRLKILPSVADEGNPFLGCVRHGWCLPRGCVPGLTVIPQPRASLVGGCSAHEVLGPVQPCAIEAGVLGERNAAGVVFVAVCDGAHCLSSLNPELTLTSVGRFPGVDPPLRCSR